MKKQTQAERWRSNNNFHKWKKKRASQVDSESILSACSNDGCEWQLLLMLLRFRQVQRDTDLNDGERQLPVSPAGLVKGRRVPGRKVKQTLNSWRLNRSSIAWSGDDLDMSSLKKTADSLFILIVLVVASLKQKFLVLKFDCSFFFFVCYFVRLNRKSWNLLFILISAGLTLNLSIKNNLINQSFYGWVR